MNCTTILTPIAAATTAVALGYFDGVHLGHRRVFAETQRIAQASGLTDAVFTFRLPPSGGAGKGRLLLSEEEKRRRIAALGVQDYFCPPFESFCGLSPAQFVDDVLVHCLHARAVLCGENFTFGAHKSGNVPILRALCEASGIAVHIVEMAQYADDVVSSTRVRQALSDGNVQDANAMLGEPYRLDLPVRAARVGDLPVLAQDYPAGMLVPSEGVYLTEALVNGAWQPACSGVLKRPQGAVCATYLPTYEGAAPDGAVPVRFARRLKPAVQFANEAALVRYICDAGADAQAHFAQLR